MDIDKSSNVNLKELQIVEFIDMSATSGWVESEVEDLARKNKHDIVKDKDGKYYISLDGFFVKCDDEKNIKDIIKKINLNMIKNPKGTLMKQSYDSIEIVQDEGSLPLENISGIIENINSEENEEKRGRYCEELKDYGSIILDVDELSIDGERLEDYEGIVNELIDKCNISSIEGKKVIDFEKVKDMPDFIQGYILEELLDGDINITKDDAKTMQEIKRCSDPYTNLLRGNYDNFFFEQPKNKTNIMDRDEYDVKDITVKILKLIDVKEIMPSITEDIIVYRGGAGVDKNKEVGSKNQYDSIVSTSNDFNVAKKFQKGVIYKQVISKGSKIVPMDLLPGVRLNVNENEILQLPFEYQVSNLEEKDGISYITMDNTKELDTLEILEKRLEELEEVTDRKKESIETLDLENENRRCEQLLEQIEKSRELIEKYKEKNISRDGKEIDREEKSDIMMSKLIGKSKEKVKFSKLQEAFTTMKDKILGKTKDKTAVKGEGREND